MFTSCSLKDVYEEFERFVELMQQNNKVVIAMTSVTYEDRGSLSNYIIIVYK